MTNRQELVAYAIVAFHIMASSAVAQQQFNPFDSWFVVQTGPVSSPTEGGPAIRMLRACPNNDGGTSLPSNVRLKVVLLDANLNGMVGVPASDICILLNGGTAAQGFFGIGADSVIANSQFNPSPLCPDLRCIQADAPTDALGVTYITLAGSTPGSPGVATRDPNRKWGHYDSKFPVNALGWNINGRATSTSAHGSYVLRIKNCDLVGGLGTPPNQGETVTILDYNSISNNIGVNDQHSYWRDLDNSGSVNITDVNIVTEHLNHDCDTPNSP
jgi:hypothetical protein